MARRSSEWPTGKCNGFGGAEISHRLPDGSRDAGEQGVGATARLGKEVGRGARLHGIAEGEDRRN